MIYICRIFDAEVKKSCWNSRYAIVRSFKKSSNPSLEKFEQMDVLSPSKELFYKYRDLVSRGEWNQEAFDNIYVPEFLRQMHGEAERKALNELFVRSKTENILLCCFCEDESECHRSIIAGLLQGAGADVRTASGKDYSKYFAMWKNVR